MHSKEIKDPKKLIRSVDFLKLFFSLFFVLACSFSVSEARVKNKSRKHKKDQIGHDAPTKEIPVNSGRSLRQQVDTYAEFIQKEIIHAKNNKERFKVLAKIDLKFHELRKMKSEVEDEAYINKILEGFSSLPKEKIFKKQNCLNYKKDFSAKYPMGIEGHPQEQSAKYAWLSLIALCD